MLELIIPEPAANGTEPMTTAGGLLLHNQTERAVRLYHARGWSVVPVPAGHKDLRVRGWDQIEYTNEEDIRSTFARLADEYAQMQFGGGKHFNLVLLLGKKSNDTFDVDLDHPLAIALARKILPPTGAVAGRESNPSSRWLYRVPGFEHRIKKYWLDPTRVNEKGYLVLELRGNGQSSTVPPGMHPDREAVRWEEGKGDAPSVVSAEALMTACGKLAATTIVTLNWVEGRRHALTLSLSGWLAKDAGWSRDEVREWIHLVATTADDEELLSRLDDVDSTFKQLAEKGRKQVSGFKGVADILGTETAELLARYFQLDEESRLSGLSLRDRIREEMSKGAKNVEAIVTMIISDLDARGVRYRHSETAGVGYYFDRMQNRFTLADWNAKPQALAVSEFGLDLFSHYGITQSHAPILNRLRPAFMVDARPVQPQSFSYATPDALYLQQSTSEVLKVTAEKIERVPNGTDDVLFLPIHMEQAVIDLATAHQPPQRVLQPLIAELSLEKHAVFTDEELRALIEVYFHLAPHLWKWRDLQLPFIVAYGEAGAGKSDLFHLVQGIALGLRYSHLRRTPTNQKDFDVYAYNARGFFVMDNFKNGTVKDYQAVFEANLATAITLGYMERRLFHTQIEEQYTLHAIPCLSTTEQVLFGDDVISRLLIIPFKKLVFDEGPDEVASADGEEESVGLWAKDALRLRPGRDALYTDQVAALRRFLELAAEPHPRHRRRTDRFPGFGSALLRMADALGGAELLEVMHRVVTKLPEATNVAQMEADKALLTLRDYAIKRLERADRGDASLTFPASEMREYIVAMGSGKPQFPFADGAQLGRYLREKKTLIYTQAGIRDTGRRRHNTALYEIDPEIVRGGWVGEANEEDP